MSDVTRLLCIYREPRSTNRKMTGDGSLTLWINVAMCGVFRTGNFGATGASPFETHVNDM